MENRLKKFRTLLQENNLDGAIVYGKESRRYLSGFTGSTGYLIISREGAAFITDFRYKEQAEKQCKGYEVIIHNNTLMENIKGTVQRYGIKKLAIEDAFMTVNFFNDLKANIEGIELLPMKDMLESIRMIKDDSEIADIEKAAAIADAAFSHILGFIKPGLTESEVALELEYFMKKNGASALSFESIVASGVRSSLPHGIASEKVINSGEFLTMDFGCVYNGYCSDMTRTVIVGKATEEQRKIYDIVLRAQEEALKNIKPGVTGQEADKAARDIIVGEGYGSYFGHGLGHGVGLAVHEEPRLSPVGSRVLQPGMVVTDEPGIYIPDFGGVRIEDLVVVTESGCKILSKSDKKLIEL